MLRVIFHFVADHTSICFVAEVPSVIKFKILALSMACVCVGGGGGGGGGGGSARRTSVGEEVVELEGFKGALPRRLNVSCAWSRLHDYGN